MIFARFIIKQQITERNNVRMKKGRITAKQIKTAL